MSYRKILFLVVAVVSLLTVVFFTNYSAAKKETEAAFRLDLKAPVNKWDEAIPLGNGLTGGLLWGEGNEIRLSLDRGEIWDLRPHPGYIVSGFSNETVCRMAFVGKANRSLENLKDYMDCISRNGFHLNGPQTRKELSDYYKMRAFTLEGNFAASQAVNEMLLQSWGGKIRIFPAVPETWADASFHQLRAEGGFIINAERKGGKTVRVAITSTVDQPLVLQDPFEYQEYKSNIKLERGTTGELSCKMNKGETLLITLKNRS